MSIQRDLPTRPVPVGPQSISFHSLVDPDTGARDEYELAHGDFVGRYSVLSRLGRGGMGVIYKAYDPRLDRNIALKLLRHGRGHDPARADLRLLREAQTLAKLKHPNIVTVHDAGLTNLGVFIAMELCEGQTLGSWLKEKSRSLREILEVFIAAGRGLAAAHQAGFIHRDFKPSNVLVGSDGSVRVLDFGLAHLVDIDHEGRDTDRESLGEPGATDELSLAPSPAESLRRRPTFPERPDRMIYDRLAVPDRLDRSLSGAIFTTRDSVIMGTPAYMAPEQLQGSGGDHRSEQFSYCLCLFMALYGRSPIPGDTFEERRSSVEGGISLNERELKVGPGDQPVPARIRRLLIRGLSLDPAARFDSMDDLLAELVEPSRRWGGVLTAFTLLLGFGVGALVFADERPEPCAEPRAALEQTWGDEDRRAVEAAFVGSGHPEASDLLQRVERQLDAQAEAWTQMYASSCRATFITHQQSEPLFDRRMHCLQRHRNRMKATIEALAEASNMQEVVERTLLPFKLLPLDECANLEALQSEQPLPQDHGLRQRIAGVRAGIDRATTLAEIGQYQQSLELAETALAEARAMDYPPVLAEALECLGRMQANGGSSREAEATLGEAITVAARARSDKTAAMAWTSMIYALMAQNEIERGQGLELAATAAVERAGDPVVRGWLLNNLGTLRGEGEDFERAREYLRLAIETKEQALGEGHVDVGLSWFNLGTALADRGDQADALPAFQRARSIFEGTVGNSHSLTYYAISGLCQVEQESGNSKRAVSLCGDVLAYYQSSPPSPFWQSRVQFMMARALWDEGRHDEARTTARDARTVIAEDNPDMAEDIGRWLAGPDSFDAEQDREQRAASAKATDRRPYEGEPEASPPTDPDASAPIDPDASAPTEPDPSSPTEPPPKESPRAESPSAESPSAESPSAESPRAESPRAESPWDESPLAEPRPDNVMPPV